MSGDCENRHQPECHASAATCGSTSVGISQDDNSNVMD